MRASLTHQRSTTAIHRHEIIVRALPRAARGARGPAWDFARVSVLPPSRGDGTKSSDSAMVEPGEDVSQSDGAPAEPMTPPTPAPAPGVFPPNPPPPPAPAKPASTKKAKLKSGPTYTPSGTIKATKQSDGSKTATFTLGAEFENDPAHDVDPAAGEVRQFIQWTKEEDIPNHAGFRPKTDYKANTWYEDRDSVGKRYGRRTGPYAECVSVNHYEDKAGNQNCASGEVFVGRDDPTDGSGAKTGKWLFELRAFDVANGDASLGTPASVAVDWNV